MTIFLLYEHHQLGSSSTTRTYTTVLWPFFREYLGEPVPEEIFFWTSWSNGKYSEADTLTIRLGATPSRLISDPPPSSPILRWTPFLPEPSHLSWLGTGTKYAGLHNQWLGLVAAVVVGLLKIAIERLNSRESTSTNHTHTQKHQQTTN